MPLGLDLYEVDYGYHTKLRWVPSPDFGESRVTIFCCFHRLGREGETKEDTGCER